MRYLAGKVAFITGGASGIGYAMAEAFLNEGMKVVVADYSATNLADAADRLAARAGDHLLLRLDVRDRAALADAADTAEARFGRIDLLCNNAGVADTMPVHEAGFADWDRMLSVNLLGAINTVVTMLPRIRRHGDGGHIVNTASIAAILPLPDPGVMYTTTKFAIRGLSASLRLALVDDRIGVSCLFPGLTKTRLLDATHAAIDAGSEAELDPLAAGFANASRFAMDPADLARAVVDGVKANQAHILAHSEFADEIASLDRELAEAIRHDIKPLPERAEFEASRRRMIEELKQRMQW